MPKKPVNTNMIPLDGLGIIPERDAGKPPILDIRHLCVDFGGLRAVDDFTLLIGKTEKSRMFWKVRAMPSRLSSCMDLPRVSFPLSRMRRIPSSVLPSDISRIA